MSEVKFHGAASIEQWPRPVRGLLGILVAGFAAWMTYSIAPIRAFPLLVAFPTVILCCWFLGMWGGIFCALSEAVFVDMFLTRPQLHFSLAVAPQGIRLSIFLVITIALGGTLRRLAKQRAEMGMQDLQVRLSLADAERRMAEERARTSEALREREEMLQIALQSNGMGLWVWDLQDGTVHWSDEKYRIIGCEPGSVEPSSETWLRFVHPEDLESVKEAISISRAGLEEYHIQYRIIRPDGAVRWLESKGKYQRGIGGELNRVMGVVSDVTQRKLAEEAMLRAEKLAVVGRLAASVAHEINNPLAAVANLLYLISLADTTAGAQEHARQAMDELMRVSLITQQTLKFHRQTGSPKVTRLSELVAAVLALFRGKLMAAGIRAEVRAEGELDISCMPSETQQIFANLMSNAVEAMPKGGRLVIRLRPSRDWRDRRNAGMRVTFCDSGVGMSRITMQRIFEPFFTTKLETGTGLGMWVVAQLVERQRGHVNVWSTERKGSSGSAFSVFLPLQSASVMEVEPDSPEMTAAL